MENLRLVICRSYDIDALLSLFSQVERAEVTVKLAEANITKVLSLTAH